ncbi:hypothetical protein JZU69_00650 [bacterium]|nr:hypothetical protein [bacterium]
MKTLEKFQKSIARYITPQNTVKTAAITLLITPIYLGYALNKHAYYNNSNYQDFAKKGIILGCYNITEKIPYKRENGENEWIVIYDNSVAQRMRKEAGIGEDPISVEISPGKLISNGIEENRLENQPKKRLEDIVGTYSKEKVEKFRKDFFLKSGWTEDEYKGYETKREKQEKRLIEEHKHKIPPVTESTFKPSDPFYLDQINHCPRVREDYNRAHRTMIEAIRDFSSNPLKETSRIISIFTLIGLAVSVLMLVAYRAFLHFRASGNPLSNPHGPTLTYASTGVIIYLDSGLRR